MASGSASRWWLHNSLTALRHELSAQGSELILRSGDAASTLAAIAEETGATAVYCSRHYQPWSETLERSVKAAVSGVGADLKRYRYPAA